MLPSGPCLISETSIRLVCFCLHHLSSGDCCAVEPQQCHPPAQGLRSGHVNTRTASPSQLTSSDASPSLAHTKEGTKRRTQSYSTRRNERKNLYWISQCRPRPMRLKAHSLLCATSFHTFDQPPLRRPVGCRQTRAWTVVLHCGAPDHKEHLLVFSKRHNERPATLPAAVTICPLVKRVGPSMR